MQAVACGNVARFAAGFAHAVIHAAVAVPLHLDATAGDRPQRDRVAGGVALDLRNTVAPNRRVENQRRPEVEAGHLIIRRVVQQVVKVIVAGLLAPRTLSVGAVQLQGQFGDVLSDGAGAGEHRR